jgi:predicted transcriptional regulator
MWKTKVKRMFERYQTVLPHLQGMTYAQIVEIVGRSAMTVGKYVQAHREKGIEGLNMGQSSGKPPYLSSDVPAALQPTTQSYRRLMGIAENSVIYNVFYCTVNEIRLAVQGFISEINKTPMKIVDRLCLLL